MGLNEVPHNQPDVAGACMAFSAVSSLSFHKGCIIQSEWCMMSHHRPRTATWAVENQQALQDSSGGPKVTQLIGKWREAKQNTDSMTSGPSPGQHAIQGRTKRSGNSMCKLQTREALHIHKELQNMHTINKTIPVLLVSAWELGPDTVVLP